MSVAATALWELRTTGSNTTCSGLFDPGQTAGMNTDGAATSANTASPVFTSASYNFVSGDVGAWLFIASGTNWIPGWYQIASVASNAATLTATVGEATLWNSSNALNVYVSTVAGCATTGSPTGATWSIDYSQQNSAQFSYTDLVIGSTTTNLTSSGNPFGKQQVGNAIQVTSGTNFTTGWYTINSVSSVTATMDRSVGTAAASSGHGYQGGALATFPQIMTNLAAASIGASGQITFVKATASYVLTANMNQSSGQNTIFIGYTTYRGDAGQPTVTTATNSTAIYSNFSNSATFAFFINFIFTNTAGTPAQCFVTSNRCDFVYFANCTFSGFTHAVDSLSGSGQILYCHMHGCTISSCTSDAFNWNSIFGNVLNLEGCLVQSSTGSGVKVGNTNVSSTGSVVILKATVLYNNSADGINIAVDNGDYINCAVYLFDSAIVSSGTDGIHLGSGGTHYRHYVNIVNSIFSNNAGYDINFEATMPIFGYANAFYNTGSGNIHNGQLPPGSVILTGQPFNNVGLRDFSLNSTSGAGAACVGTGWPLVVPGA